MADQFLDSVLCACSTPKLDDLINKFSPSLSCGHVRYLLHHLESGLQRLAEEPHQDLQGTQLGLLNWSLVHVNEVALEAKGCWLPFTLDEILAQAPTAVTFGTWKGLGVSEDSGRKRCAAGRSGRAGRTRARGPGGRESGGREWAVGPATGASPKGRRSAAEVSGPARAPGRAGGTAEAPAAPSPGQSPRADRAALPARRRARGFKQPPTPLPHPDD